MRRPVAGDTPILTTANPPKKRSCRVAFPAIRRSNLATSSSRATPLDALQDAAGHHKTKPNKPDHEHTDYGQETWRIDMTIQDSVVFVTGANRGLGLAFA